MSAKDFITNVSKTFDEVPSAQIIQGPTPKYTIKGLKPRVIPVDQTRRPMVRCLWKVNEGALGDHNECGWWYQRPRELWEHVVQRHLGIEKDGEGGWKIDDDDLRTFDCEWAGCHHFSKNRSLSSKYIVGQHIKTHLPDGSAKRALHREHSKFSPSEDDVQPRIWLNTPLDERKEATGIPVSSAIVLRNLARQMVKIEGAKDVEAEGGWIKRVFLPFKEEIFWVMGNNLSLRDYMTALVRVLANAGVLS
jgi:chromatin structure-remodeling complex subunit RSC9